MGFTGTKYAHCRKCGKKTQFVRCPRCNGRGGGLTTHCNHCQNSGYKCQNGTNDQWHS